MKQRSIEVKEGSGQDISVEIQSCAFEQRGKQAPEACAALKEAPVFGQVSYAGIFTYGTDQKQAASLSLSLF